MSNLCTNEVILKIGSTIVQKKSCAKKEYPIYSERNILQAVLPLTIYLHRCVRTWCGPLVQACKILNNWVSCCLYIHSMYAQHHSTQIFVEFSIMYRLCMPIYRSFVKFRSKSSNLCTFNYFGVSFCDKIYSVNGPQKLVAIYLFYPFWWPFPFNHISFWIMCKALTVQMVNLHTVRRRRWVYFDDAIVIQAHRVHSTH